MYQSHDAKDGQLSCTVLQQYIHSLWCMPSECSSLQNLKKETAKQIHQIARASAVCEFVKFSHSVLKRKVVLSMVSKGEVSVVCLICNISAAC